eukprot:1158748-Pelagomonas_calceolata.AAC.5
MARSADKGRALSRGAWDLARCLMSGAVWMIVVINPYRKNPGHLFVTVSTEKGCSLFNPHKPARELPCTEQHMLSHRRRGDLPRSACLTAAPIRVDPWKGPFCTEQRMLSHDRERGVPRNACLAAALTN